MLVGIQRKSLYRLGPVLAAVFSAVGFLFFPAVTTLAALTTPTSIISGSSYADGTTYENLGWNRDDDHPAWPLDGQYRRRVLFVSPESSLSILFAAYVNDDPSVCSGSVCRLEFKQSIDGGITWMSAIESGTQYLPIYVGSGAGDYDTDYTITVGANGKDIWVAYRPDNALDTHIRKLSWYSSVRKWQMGVTANVDHRPQIDKDTGAGVDIVQSIGLAVFVQNLGGNERVWALGGDWDGNAYQWYAAYTDNFATANPTWTLGSTPTNDVTFLPASRRFPLGGPTDHMVTFLPVGIARHPALVLVPYWVYSDDSGYGSCVTSPSANPRTRVFILGDSVDPTTWTETASAPELINRQAYEWAETRIWPEPPGINDDCRPSGAAVPNTGWFPMDYSVIAAPIDATSSRIVVAYEGGYAAGESYDAAIARQDRVFVKSCTLSPSGLSSCSEVEVGAGRKLKGPSIGFWGTAVYLAARDITNPADADLTIYREDTLTPYAWEAAPLLAAGAGNTTSGAYIPSLPPETPDTFTTNSGLPPVAWEQAGAQRIAFSANSGGNVYGYGWSSNFGWLSLNCANFKTADACSPPTSSPYGVNIGTAALNTPPTQSFSPSPTGQTYPGSGYGWSSNAGFLSFRRLDSVCDTGAGCTGGEDNDYGNPLGQAYRNSTLTTDATLKYDKTTQKLNGWGRFLNLCNYSDIGGGTYRCFDRDGGWVRFQGYWRDSTKFSALRLNYVSGNLYLPVDDSSLFPDPAVTGKPEIGIIGEEYFYYTGLGPDAFGNPALTLETPEYENITRDYPAGTPVHAAGGEYGVSAYYSGNGYLFSGWAWSAEYGWIRFNPLIFLGYAWLESLFGNIYVSGGGADAGNFQLPDAQRLTGERLTSCGRDLDGDGDGDEACYVSTYRIEASGALQPLAHPSGQSVSAGSSASVEFLESLAAGSGACGFDGSDEACSRLLGITDPTALFNQGSSTSAFGFPSVQPSTATYRNALGKLDVGGLTRDVSYLYNFLDFLGLKDYQRSVNRFGHKLFRTTLDSNDNPVNWTVGELAGNYAYNPPPGPVLPPDIPLDVVENQVIHIQGDLTIGHDPNEVNAAASTLTSLNRGSGPPSYGTLTLASAANFPPTVSSPYPVSGTVILGTGSGNEEYFSYTGKSGNQLTGVQSITGNPYTAGDHPAGTTVRWVWRLPYTVGQTTPRSVTFVVDGDLKIHYNIIASDPTADLDLSTVAPSSIRDAVTAAFIVRGNVSIAKEVNRITGAFVVIGRDSAKDPDLNAEAPSSACLAEDYGYDGCGGSFDTGNDADPAFCGGTDKKCNPLSIEGLLFARRFNFTRTGALDTIDQPAEQVIFDQRLFLNPPPGLEDVTKALPNPTRELP